MTLEETIKTFENNADYERQQGDLQSCLHFKQLVEWLTKLQYYQRLQPKMNSEWAELIKYRDGIEKIKMRIHNYRKIGEDVLASGMEQALDILNVKGCD